MLHNYQFDKEAEEKMLLSDLFFETETSLIINDNIYDLSSKYKSVELRAKELGENTN